MDGTAPQGDTCEPSWAAPHKLALAAGNKFYKDPDTGLMVMTEVAHLSRGKCCGSGCRHCPYSHDRVPLSKRAQLIKKPAWLVPPQWTTKIRCDGAARGSDGGISDSAFKVVVLFWSTGKDSYLAYRALRRATEGKQTEADPRIPLVRDQEHLDNTVYPQLRKKRKVQVDRGSHIILLTTCDSETRQIAHQDTNISDALAQAQALGAPLMGVPLLRGGDSAGEGGGYIEVVRRALAMIRHDIEPHGGQLAGLAFGDLHLMHVRTWRETARLQQDTEQLIFPLWKREEADMVAELETCGAPCVVSSVTEEGRGVVEVGERFTRELWLRVRKAGKDGFGENGEFHTLAKVWESPSLQW